MLTDLHGNVISTVSPDAHTAYLEGSRRLLSADAGTEAAFRNAVAADDRFALGHIALARTLQVMGRGREARAPLTQARELAASTTPREQSHIDIMGKILDGQGAAALQATRVHIASWPRDAMTLAPCTGVFGLVGFSGRIGREQDQLDLLKPLADHYGDDWWYRTVLAFAEIELQLHDQGERNILAALQAFPRNAHAAHIRAHQFYERGERDDGRIFLTDWMRDYPRDGQLHCHASWHLALWALETGDREEAWRIYDESLRPGAAWGPQLNVLTDCASFLFRAEIAGEPRKPELWSEISAYATQWFPATGVTFADVHAAVAHAMAGDGAALARLTEAPKGAAGDLLAPLAQGLSAFARQDWIAAADALRPLLAVHERIGGSRAQRDLIEYAMAAALLRAGRSEEARSHIATRRPKNMSGGLPVAGL